MKKTTTAKNLILDKEIFPKRTLPALSLVGINKDLFTRYADKADQQYVYEHGMRMIHLPEVRVTAQQKNLKKSQYYDMATHTITADFINKSTPPNILWYLVTVPGVRINHYAAGGNPKVLLGMSPNTPPPALIVDGMFWNIEDIDIISPADVAQIDVLMGANAMAFGPRAFGGAIYVFTKGPEDYKDSNYAPHIKNISPLGFQQLVEFYAPKYDTPEKRNERLPDLRTTIHWQPVVQTDNQGESSFEFYTADEPTSYTVIIEGLADDGSIIRKEEKLSVKDK
ncbi:MAG: Plug domain-containing protein [Dysgonamonadaceae bacterium]|jgi:hypothetical protein|nr:Plug domain-containing protein [Dysgonamonadaceae bacterium]